MKTIQSFVLGLLCCLPFLMSAQSNPVTEQPYIDVIGKAELSVVPDMIFVSIVVKERQEGRDRIITVEQQEKDLKAALQAANISIEKLSLADASADYVRVKIGRRDVIQKKAYVLELNDAPSVAKVFELLDKLKIEDANISRVDHSKMDELKQQVNIMAVKAAKKKADYLAEAVGEKIGKALQITEQSSVEFDYAQVNNIRQNEYKSYDKDYGDDVEIGFQKIKLQASVYVKYAL